MSQSISLNINDIPIPAIVVNDKGIVISMNNAFIESSKYQKKSLINKSCSLFLPGLISDNFAQALSKTTENELLDFVQNGDDLLGKVTINKSKLADDYLLLFDFIETTTYLTPNRLSTTKKQFLKSSPDKSYKLLQEQNHYLSLYEKMNDSGFWHIDFKNNSLFWSEGIFRIHGVDEESYTPSTLNYLDYYLPEDKKIIKQCIEKAIKDKTGFVCKGTIVRRDNTRVKVESIGEIEVDTDGNVIGIIGVFRNITKQVQNIEKLKLLAIVNYTISVPIFFIDEKDNVVYQDLTPLCINVPSGLFSYLNFSIEEYIDYKKKARVQGQVKESNISFDQYNTVYDFSVTYEPDEKIYIWIVENVTEKFRKEQQQMISNRLTLLGNTFGNVSHDINNVLGVALGSVEMLELKLLKGEKDIASYVDRVKNAIDKGKSITERLLAFTRKQTVKIVQFDPDKDIMDNQYLFKQLLLTTISLKFELSKEACIIKFPQGEFINILLNLVLNAQDAIQEQGTSGEIIISSEFIADNRYVVHVKDSGIGIESHLLSKIFDPFYSSKSVNKGNGIGLANVYNTMYKHNGEIKVQGNSEIGGAQFSLVFKAELLKKPRVPKKAIKELNLLNKNVLVLDDEESIADFVAMYIENQGANVNCVNSKEELIRYLALSQPVDIFITDMIMPDFTGKEAVDLVLAHNNNATIYSMSGYIGQKEQEWHYPVLRKPFNSSELLEFIS